MTKTMILETIKALAKSQGFYRRLLNAIQEDGGLLDQLHNAASLSGCKDIVDLILLIEG